MYTRIYSSGIYTHTLDAAMGTVPCWQGFILQVRIANAMGLFPVYIYIGLWRWPSGLNASLCC